MTIEVRNERPEHSAAIQGLHTKAFGGSAEAKLVGLISERKKALISLVAISDDSVVGLIINRRTQIPLARVFPELKEAKGQTDPIYRGGPVERTAALAK